MGERISQDFVCTFLAFCYQNDYQLINLDKLKELWKEEFHFSNQEVCFFIDNLISILEKSEIIERHIDYPYLVMISSSITYWKIDDNKYLNDLLKKYLSMCFNKTLIKKV